MLSRSRVATPRQNTSSWKSEATCATNFSRGKIFAIAGASITHNIIAGNLYIALRRGLRGKKCRMQMEAVRLAVEENRPYAYPEVMVSCDLHDQRESQQLHHPLLIVKVLSPSFTFY